MRLPHFRTLLCIVLFTLFAPPLAAAEKAITIRSAGWTIKARTHTGTARHRDGRRRMLWSTQAPSPECEFYIDGRLLSVVGSMVSFEIREGPSHVRSFTTIDLDTGREVSLYDLFDRRVVDAAMAADPYLLKTKDDSYATSCLYSLTNFERSFAFVDVRNDTVGIRVGLMHGCEVQRGRITELGLQLSASRRVRREVRAAAKTGRLLRAMRKRVPWTAVD
jgi:hypothetical protein